MSNVDAVRWRLLRERAEMFPPTMGTVAETANLPGVRDDAILDGAAAAVRAAGGKNLTGSTRWQDPRREDADGAGITDTAGAAHLAARSPTVIQVHVALRVLRIAALGHGRRVRMQAGVAAASRFVPVVTLAELSVLLREGENSGVEFKRDDVQPHDFAEQLVALSNLRGGRILLGVEDDGTISGLTRDAVDEWVLTIARDKVRPPLIPYVQTVTDPGTGRRVAVVTVEAGYAVHAVWHNNHFAYYVRAGRQSREASPEELSRLQQRRGGFRAELRPISGSAYEDLDQRRLTDYFHRVRGQRVPDPEDRKSWVRLLSATEFLVEGVGEPVPCLAAIALFGRSTARYLPQSGIDAVAYPGLEKDYAAVERATLRGPLAPLMTSAGELVEPGLVDSAAAFVRRNVGVRAQLADGVRRVETPGLPVEPVREVLVNAVIHRDYLLAHTDTELGLYPDRLEIVSPGRLPNGVTVERMLAGTRAARNEILKDVLRDYGYLEHMGLGVPRKIVRGMQEFNGSEPEFIVGEESLTVVLRRST